MEPRTVRELTASDLPDAMELVWRVFAEFEAPDYSPEGIGEFRRYIEPTAMKRWIAEGLRLWGREMDSHIAGVIAMRPPGHVSLLFVDKPFHRQGVARTLWETAREYYREAGVVTVHSSPYALEAYRRLGFRETGPEQTENGLRFISMEFTF